MHRISKARHLLRWLYRTSSPLCRSLCQDKGLQEVLELNPVKKMALYNGMNICRYKIGFGDLLPEATILLSGDGVQERRQAVFRERDIDAIISNLEMEIEILN